ncbi:MAG TPA: helix-turn-helix domain-containing protein [Bacilli bacterium]|jgi:excisionase family DNA binding protein|nr:helix-turn-helix domain-containing protein [Bacilli bacterium]
MEINYYTLKEISVLLKTPIHTLRKCIKEKKLRGAKLGCKYLISSYNLNQFINKYLNQESDYNEF